MGQAGRLKMEREFDERRVLEQYRSAISVALGQPHAAALAQEEPRT
jgi:hypothetical protein